MTSEMGNSSSSEWLEEYHMQQGFSPTVLETLVVKAMLRKTCKLPMELVDTILDRAEYWPHTTAEVDYRQTPGGMRAVMGGRGDRENQFLIRSCPLGFVKCPNPHPEEYLTTRAEPRNLAQERAPESFQKLIGSVEPTVTHPCRKIVFTIVSKDQGFGGEGGGDDAGHSWTWFDVGLERFDTESKCEPDCPDGGPDTSNPSTSGKGVKLPICALRPLIPSIKPSPINGDESAEDAPLRYDFDLLPSGMTLQKNRLDRSPTHRGSDIDFRTYRIEWRWTDAVSPDSFEGAELERQGRGKETLNGEFVRNLKLGDVVTVWAKARFPLWSNKIQRVKMEIYWVV